MPLIKTEVAAWACGADWPVLRHGLFLYRFREISKMMLPKSFSGTNPYVTFFAKSKIEASLMLLFRRKCNLTSANRVVSVTIKPWGMDIFAPNPD